VPPGKKLVLKRVVTKSYPDGRVEKIEDDVAADVGETWMKHRKFKPDGSVDADASRDAVMKILYPHGVDPPAYVSGGSVGGGGVGGLGAAGDASLNRTIKAPNFVGTADQKADLLRLRKRKMELLRRRKKKAEQLRAEAGLSQQDLAAMAEKAEKAENPEGGAPKKLKIALSFKLGANAGGGAGPSRFAPKEETRATKPTTSRFRATSSRDDVLCQIAEGLASVPAYAAFAAPVTKKALPDYHKFVSRKMDLGTIARAAKRAGGYESVDAWMRDVRQILTNARLYHEADEDVLIRVPAIVDAAEQLVRDAETALEARANDITQFDPAFDLEKVLGRTTHASEAE
jgi:transcription initiation factor TFIID subunit 1